jgi:hypothetical protein
MVGPCYCVVCVVRLQFKILWQGYIKKKITVSPTDYNPSVFHRELQNNYRIVPLSPTDHNPSVFHRQLQKNYGIVPPLPTAYNPSVFHRELQKKLRDCATITNMYTDGFTDIEYRWIYAHPEAHTCLTRVRLHQYRRIFWRIEKSGGIFELFWCAFQLITDGITDGN